MKDLFVLGALGVASMGLFMLLKILIGTSISIPVTLIVYGTLYAAYLTMDKFL